MLKKLEKNPAERFWKLSCVYANAGIIRNHLFIFTHVVVDFVGVREGKGTFSSYFESLSTDFRFSCLVPWLHLICIDFYWCPWSRLLRIQVFIWIRMREIRFGERWFHWMWIFKRCQRSIFRDYLTFQKFQKQRNVSNYQQTVKWIIYMV